MPYIPESQDWEPGRTFFTQLFNGELPYGLHINFTYGKHQIQNCDGLLIKFCRANLLLPWLCRQFPEIRPIHLIRHPLSVISSQFRHPAFRDVGIKHHLFEIRKNGNPVFSDIFDRHYDKISKIRSRESLFANWWAIQNSVVLKAEHKNWIAVSYESLYLNSTMELERIAAHLGVHTARFSTQNLHKPSYTANTGSEVIESKNHLSNFKRYLSKDQIKEILDIIQSYEIDCYSDALEPHYDRLGY
jgi:hypothetical protein